MGSGGESFPTQSRMYLYYNVPAGWKYVVQYVLFQQKAEPVLQSILWGSRKSSPFTRPF